MRFGLILSMLFAFSCSHEHDRELYIGELFFSPWHMGSFYGLADSVRLKFEHTMDTLRLDRTDSGSQATFELYHNLKSNGLLYKPFVELLSGDSSFFVILLLDSSDYDRIKIFKRQDLLDNHKKVVIWGRTKHVGEMSSPLLYCTQLVDVELVDGQTYPERSGKLRIDDYK